MATTTGLPGGTAVAGDDRRPGAGQSFLQRTGVPRWAVTLAATTIVLVYVLTTMLAMRQTSATFDEILLPAAGARGYVTGDFELIRLYHPRLLPYLYGLPVVLSRPAYPARSEMWNERGGAFAYAQELFFDRGNDSPSLVFRVRLIAVVIGAALVLLVFAFVRRHYGDPAALVAAAMTAFLPDLIAHGGIAYNDVPAALAIFGAVWALQRAAADPVVGRVLLAAVITGLALVTKYSAIVLAPVAVLLIALEAVARGRSGWKDYLLQTARLLPIAALGVYLLLVVVYMGDFTLGSFRDGLSFNITHAKDGHGGLPAWLLGRRSPDGFWYFFPIAFLIKTPAALHVLLLIGLGGLFMARGSITGALRSPLRGPVVATAVFGFFLLTSGLNIGFRHALPVLPFLVVIGAVGLARVWGAHGRRVRLLIAGLVFVQALSVLSWYPHFIPYTSEYFPDRDLGFARVSDSSHDWGQGLSLLRDFMEEEDVEAVYLSYFGSANPEAYGIRYVPLRSFLELPPSSLPIASSPLLPQLAVAGDGLRLLPLQGGESEFATAPRLLAISATNLVGSYVSDVFAPLRQLEPYRVLGHSIFVYRLSD
jgi:hypothetical protein